MPNSEAAAGISHTTLQSLAGDLGRYAEKQGLAYFDRLGDHSWSYLMLSDHVERLARGLIEHGTKAGDRLAISARNRPEWIAACLASLRSGAVVVPLDTQLSDEALRHALRDSGARLLFTTGAEAGRLRPACGELGVEIILLDDDGRARRGGGALMAEPAFTCIRSRTVCRRSAKTMRPCFSTHPERPARRKACR